MLDRHECFQFFITCKRTNNANNATHYVKLGKKRRESSKRNYECTEHNPYIWQLFAVKTQPQLSLNILCGQIVRFQLTVQGGLHVWRSIRRNAKERERYTTYRPLSHDKVRERTAYSPLSYQRSLRVVPGFRTDFRTLAVRSTLSWRSVRWVSYRWEGVHVHL